MSLHMCKIITFPATPAPEAPKEGRMSWMRLHDATPANSAAITSFLLACKLTPSHARHYQTRLSPLHDVPVLLPCDIDAPCTILQAMEVGIDIRIP